MNASKDLSGEDLTECLGLADIAGRADRTPEGKGSFELRVGLGPSASSHVDLSCAEAHVRLEWRTTNSVVEGQPRVEGPFAVRLNVRVTGKTTIAYQQVG